MMFLLGRILIILGAVMLAAGVILTVASRLGLPFGNLPGDITYKKKNITIFAPFGTMLIVSVVITLILNFISRWKN